MKKNIIPVFVTIVWLVSGLYFGIGGLSRLNFDETLKSLENNKETLMKEKVDLELDGITIENNYQLKKVHFFDITKLRKLVSSGKTRSSRC